jgi:hypothetical protein
MALRQIQVAFGRPEADPRTSSLDRLAKDRSLLDLAAFAPTVWIACRSLGVRHG